MRRVLPLVCLALVGMAIPARAADGFSDVPDGTRYQAAILDLKATGAIHGYPDGSFHPDQWLNRAEFVSMLMKAEVDPKNQSCAGRTQSPFRDVPVSAWYFRAVCGAKAKGIVQGYGNKTFKPAEWVTVEEAAKMIAVAFGEKPVTASPWYKPFIAYLGDHHAIPPTMGNPQHNITRGELAEILWRLRENRKEEESLTADEVLSSSCVWDEQSVPANVNVQEVERTWLGWINGVRVARGLPGYSYDKQLERTAIAWSGRAKAKGSISHKRDGQTLYYDYPRIEQWFKDEGLTFLNDHSMTFTENIGYGYYDCAKKDCTQALIAAIRTTFDFYKSEEGKKDAPHWNSIINPRFRLLGVGIAVDEVAKTYYITTHYATRITSDPEPVCP